jgi:hypothetical protein
VVLFRVISLEKKNDQVRTRVSHPSLFSSIVQIKWQIASDYCFCVLYEISSQFFFINMGQILPQRFSLCFNCVFKTIHCEIPFIELSIFLILLMQLDTIFSQDLRLLVKVFKKM